MFLKYLRNSQRFGFKVMAIVLADRVPVVVVDEWLQWFMMLAGIGQLLPTWISFRLNDFGFASLYIVLGVASGAVGSIRAQRVDDFLSLGMANWDDIEIMFSRWIAVFILFKTLHFKNSATYLQTYVLVSVVAVFSVFVFNRFEQEIITQVIWALAVVMAVVSIFSGLRVIWLNSFVLYPLYFILLAVAIAVPFAWEHRADHFYFALSRAVWHISAPVIAYLITATFWVETLDENNAVDMALLHDHPERLAATEPVLVRRRAFAKFNEQMSFPWLNRLLPRVMPRRVVDFLQPYNDYYSPSTPLPRRFTPIPRPIYVEDPLPRPGESASSAPGNWLPFYPNYNPPAHSTSNPSFGAVPPGQPNPSFQPNAPPYASPAYPSPAQYFSAQPPTTLAQALPSEQIAARLMKDMWLVRKDC